MVHRSTMPMSARSSNTSPRRINHLALQAMLPPPPLAGEEAHFLQILGSKKTRTGRCCTASNDYETGKKAQKRRDWALFRQNRGAVYRYPVRSKLVSCGFLLCGFGSMGWARWCVVVWM